MGGFANRVKDTTTTTGTGSLTLAGSPPTGFVAFSAAFNTGDRVYYTIDDGAGAWEVGVGTLSGATTLTRDTVLSSSNSGSLVNFGAGTKTVWCDLPADLVHNLIQFGEGDL